MREVRKVGGVRDSLSIYVTLHHNLLPRIKELVHPRTHIWQSVLSSKLLLILDKHVYNNLELITSKEMPWAWMSSTILGHTPPGP